MQFQIYMFDKANALGEYFLFLSPVPEPRVNIFCQAFSAPPVVYILFYVCLGGSSICMLQKECF